MDTERPKDRPLTSAPPVRRARRTRQTGAALAAGTLATLLAVGGCAGARDNAGASDKGMAQSDSKAAGAGAADRAGGKSTDGNKGKARADEQSSAVAHVIRTATLFVEVKNVPKAVASARATAEGAGGFVSNEATERLDDEHESSHLVLRVPEDRYQEVLRSLAGSGKLLSRTSDAKDVTEEVVDVESRIATQKASVTRVRKLMDQAEKISDVVTLEGELSSRQAALESLLARQAKLRDRTSMATITLELVEPDSPVAKRHDDDPGFLDALGGGWDAFVAMLRWIAMAIGASAPFLAVAAIVLLVWRRLRRRTGKPPASGPSAAPGSGPSGE
ncbi:DUF4349 domain-containing protein [Streptomyces finlayi]|uniref:DUF4349 domain-containing protein n=1 Tax=Streptomyces finlayi TaxID=67296 RepID=A0A7G7BFM2_9ACTN|nr:DUF4349 domain-containing protein [Streptomyces finlayi]QNE74137.1 DUF4349 domain-containing protein [Streptomyces finlayi]